MNVMDAVKNRRSVREYADRPIPPEILQRLRDALRYAPSACNYQPWKFIFIQEESQRRAVTQTCKGQNWIAGAPLIVVACGFPDRAYPSMGGVGNSIDIDLAIALDHLSLVAVAEELGTCWIGAFEESALKKVLKVPQEAKIAALMPVGYPARSNLIHPLEESRRKKPTQIFSQETY